MNTFENINTLFKAFTDKFGPIVSKRCHEFTPADFERFASLLDKYCEVKDEAAGAVKPTDTVTPANSAPNTMVEHVEDPVETEKKLRQSRPTWLKLDTLVTYMHNGSTIIGTIDDIREYINVKNKVAKFYVHVKWFTKASDIENHGKVMNPPNVLEARHLLPVFGRGCIITPENVEQLCMNLMHASIRLADTTALNHTNCYDSNICSTEIMAIKDLEYHLNKTTCNVDNILINGIYLDALLEYDPYIHIDGLHWEKLMKYIMQTVKSFNHPA